MKEISNITELAEIFYNRMMHDIELNGTYDENDPATKLSEEIDSTLSSLLDIKIVNELEERIFTLTDMYDKENYIAGFKDGINIMRSIYSEEQ